MDDAPAIGGSGLGFRRELIDELAKSPCDNFQFYELTIENWLQVGGIRAHELTQFIKTKPFVSHGLSLSIGGTAPLNEPYLHQIKAFLDQYDIQQFSDHLSYCGDEGYLYDLYPIPFTDEAVMHVANRVQRTQEILERRIALENISYYAAPGKTMSELEFIQNVIKEADCDLLFDVNNVYVNSVNHQYDPRAFIDGLKGIPIAYMHIAGHTQKTPDLLIDSHGNDVISDVWDLLAYTYKTLGVMPTLLERDNDIPALEVLTGEINQINKAMEKAKLETKVVENAS